MRARRLIAAASNRAIKPIDRFAGCFRDGRCQEVVEQRVETLVGQRVLGIALGYEDLNDHDELRHDPVMASGCPYQTVFAQAHRALAAIDTG